MGRGPQAEAIPDLAHALRHLRERAGLSARAVSERAQAAGRPVSAVYYRQIEAGRRFPSPPARAAILDALGSSEAELAALLRDRAWEEPRPRVAAGVAMLADVSPAREPTADELIAAVAAVAPALSGAQRRLVADLARELAGSRAGSRSVSRGSG